MISVRHLDVPGRARAGLHDLGDTARVPYGSKSPETVVRYAVEAAHFLNRHHVKLMVVACNTASSCALPALRDWGGGSMAPSLYGFVLQVSRGQQVRLGHLGAARDGLLRGMHHPIDVGAEIPDGGIELRESNAHGFFYSTALLPPDASRLRPAGPAIAPASPPR